MEKRQGPINVKKALEKQKFLWKNDPEWVKNIGMYNILNANKKAIEKLNYLRKNDFEWVENQRKNSIENLQKAKEARIQAVKDSISQLNLIITENSIDTSKIFELKQNDIYGAYVIKAKFKAYKDRNKENNIYNVLVCKSVKIYNEIYWVLRVLSHPEKQNKIVSENNPWTAAKWWYISNLYYDFEFVLLTDKKWCF